MHVVFPNKNGTETVPCLKISLIVSKEVSGLARFCLEGEYQNKRMRCALVCLQLFRVLYRTDSKKTLPLAANFYVPC
jgi:hypothetical protein